MAMTLWCDGVPGFSIQFEHQEQNFWKTKSFIESNTYWGTSSFWIRIDGTISANHHWVGISKQYQNHINSLSSADGCINTCMVGTTKETKWFDPAHQSN